MSQTNSIPRRILYEPLFHFMVLALLLFLLDHFFSSTWKEKIIVNPQTYQYLIKQREAVALEKLSPEEKKATINSYIDDEILYSEAYKRGLDKGDSRMRRNLILKMRGLLTDEVERPGDTQLQQYFESRRADYAYPENWSIQQVYFSDAEKMPDDLLQKLNAGLDASSLGNSRPGIGREMPNMSQRDLSGLFGAKVTQTIMGIRDKQWHGSFESMHGIHMLRITGYEPAQQANFEHIKDYLQRDWIMLQSQKIVAQEIERLRKNYDIVIENLP